MLFPRRSGLARPARRRARRRPGGRARRRFLARRSQATRRAGGDRSTFPYEEFTLPNGLRVIVHTDRKAPIVAVNLWYHVGSKDEPAGRSGFAHLFEHLMFNGSENHQGEYFAPFKQVGVTDQNGTTNSDRTNYFENVPTTALDMALWMESDRMGHLLGAIDQKTLDEQRGVVQNEKRQGENQPYGQVCDVLGRRRCIRQRIPTTTAPSARWTTSTRPRSTTSRPGSAPGTARTTRCWCWPATSTSPPRRRRSRSTSATSRPAPTMAQPQVDVAGARKATRATMTDKVPQARIYRVWNVAEVRRPPISTGCSCSRRCSAAAESRAWTRACCIRTSSSTASAPALYALAARLGTSSSSPTSSRASTRPRSRRSSTRNCSKLLDGRPDRRPNSSRRAPCSRPASCAASSASAASAARPTRWPNARCTPATPAASATRLKTHRRRHRRPACRPPASTGSAQGGHTLVVLPGERVAAGRGAGGRRRRRSRLPPVDPKFKHHRQRRRSQRGRAEDRRPSRS